MKGLPLAYCKDMQEDKEPIFDALESLALAITVTAGMVVDMVPDRARLRKAAGDGFSTATDLADWLVRNLSMPFREAHQVTGRIVAMAEDAKLPLHRLPLDDMRSVEPRLNDDIFAVLSAERSARSRTSYGGTAPANVRRQARRWLKRLAKAAEAPSAT